MNEEFAETLKKLAAEAGKYETCMSIHVSEDGGAVELLLDTGLDHYGQHIRDEGADICLYRDMETGKVVGCRLPLMNRRLAVFHNGPVKVNDGFLKGEMFKPASLTEDRCFELMPKLVTDEEWQKKHDASELPLGITGLRGMLKTVWPNERFTEEEAGYILWLKDRVSMRSLACELCGDDNQTYGMLLIEAAEAALNNKD